MDNQRDDHKRLVGGLKNFYGFAFNENAVTEMPTLGPRDGYVNWAVSFFVLNPEGMFSEREIVASALLEDASKSATEDAKMLREAAAAIMPENRAGG